MNSERIEANERDSLGLKEKILVELGAFLVRRTVGFTDECLDATPSAERGKSTLR